MKKQIKSIISLFSICAIIAIVLALTNAFTAPTIQKNEEAAANAALIEVLPTGEDFQKIDLSTYSSLPATVKEAYSEKNGGYVFKLETTGYSAGLIIMCGVSPDGTVSGTKCLASGETLGYEDTFGDLLKGKDVSNLDTVSTVSGATKTTGAYRSAIKDALNAFIILNGGVADTRTEEEILADNLSAALPSADGKFSISYLSAFISGASVDAVYTADNSSGTVFVIGKTFVGVDFDGNIIQTDLESATKSAVESAVSTMKGYTDVDLSQYSDIASEVKSVKSAENGTLVFELHAKGYGIRGGNKWVPASGKPIVICLSITADGTIIECRTMAQNESGSDGVACGESSFYSQFNGKTQSNYAEITATFTEALTIDGYKSAIGHAFTAAQIIKGGN